MSPAQPRGVHLVGSLCLSSAEEAFRQSPALLPGRLRRIPDGEPQHRQMFTAFQRDVFKAAPQVLRKYDSDFNALPADPLGPEGIESIVDSLGELHTGYDDYALESYSTFCRLREQGVIPKGVRFQVSLPTLLDVIVLVAEPFQAALEPRYEAALIRDLNKIQGTIPAEDLAIQWDFASGFAMMEEAYWPHFKPFFFPVKEHCVDSAVRLGNAVKPEVQMGFHLCYGDIGHRHFVEPKDMGLLVEVAAALQSKVQRSITWFHMPVPKDRDDAAYFAPLKNLELGETELYLGVVQAWDEEGTRRRIKAASDVVVDFGVASECGMGRTPAGDFPSIMQISATVSLPHLSP